MLHPIHFRCEVAHEKPIRDFTYGPISGTELEEEFDEIERLYGVRPDRIWLEAEYR